MRRSNRIYGRGWLALLLCGALWLTGCAINLSSVKFTEQKLSPSSRFRTLSAEQKVCEVERQLALYSDENRQLWLACPYRYEGRTVPLVAYIGPDIQKGAVEFVNDNAAQKIKALRKETLRKCGEARYCADLSGYGYMDFVVEVTANTARIRYVDLSDGLKDIGPFYAQLDGRSAEVSLDAQLVRLVDTARVVERINQLGTLAQHRNVARQLEVLGLANAPGVGPALLARGKTLQVAAFREQGTFAGFAAAYELTGDRSDLAGMQRLAETGEHKSAVFAALAKVYRQSRQAEALQQAEPFAHTGADRAELAELQAAAEQERQAELRRQEELRQAELRRQEEARQASERRQEASRLAEARRQEEARLAEQRAQQARADEQRCMSNAACRRAWEERRAQCGQKLQNCRAACDRTTGSGSYGSFISNLAAAGLARACYAGCKCDNGFGDLLARFNLSTSGAAGTTTAAAGPAATKGAQGTTAATPADAKPAVFECRIFCKSASGPTITRRIEAGSRKQAAEIASDRASEFCAQQGYSHASSVKFAESQCQAR